MIDSILADAAPIAALRRDIHAHPELCFQEQRTSDLIAKALTDWGIPIDRGLGTTGVVGIVRNGTQRPRGRPARRHRRAADDRAQHSSRTRAGTPARCMPAATTATPPCCWPRPSTWPAPQLRRHRLPRVPAGRGRRRRRARDDQGRPVRALPDGGDVRRAQLARAAGRPVRAEERARPSRRATSSRSRSAARARMRAMPHLGLDPVPVACQMVQAFQTIVTRNKRPIDTGVISVTMIHAGEATNVVPDSCVLEGTVRTFTTEVLDLIERRMKTSPRPPARPSRPVRVRVRAQLPAHDQPRGRDGVRARGAGRDGRPRERAGLRAHDGRRGLQLLPARRSPAATSSSATATARTATGGHGMGPCMLHNPSYDFNDDLIPLGATMWVRLAEKWLARSAARLSERGPRPASAELRGRALQVPDRGR